MIKHLTFVALTAALVAGAAASGRAQSKTNETTPVKVQVVIARYQGEKKVSSMPYTLTVNVRGGDPGGVAQLRMGSKIPVSTMVTPVVDGKEMPAVGPVQYHDVGTSIDCFATRDDDHGNFRLQLTVDDSSVYGEELPKTPRQPSFRSFRATNSMILKDGQTGQFTSAVDKVNGEVTRVEVTLTVVK